MSANLATTTPSRLIMLLTAATLLLALAACDRKVEPVPTVTRPANAISGPTTAQTEADDADQKSSLEYIPYLGAAFGVKGPDGQIWQKYSNGMMIQDILPGASDHAKTGQMAHVAYVGTFPGTSTIFDQADKDHPFVFRVGSKDVIKGWNLAVSTMGIGAKRKFYLPPDLAYGSRGSLPAIHPYQPLVFEIDMLNITGVPVYLPDPAATQKATTMSAETFEPIPSLGKPENFTTPDGQSWQKYPDGIMIQRLKPGAGEPPKIGQTVHVTYVGSFPVTKEIFDKHIDKDHPFTFPLGTKNIIKGWNLALSTMTKGEKIRVYIPSELAYGSAGAVPLIPQDQPLIFEIELLDITGTPANPPEPATHPVTESTPTNGSGPSSAPSTKP